jgi:transcriptional regulator with XRE-family HTH domain
MESPMKINADNVRQFRLNQGWSQEQLSHASGLGLRTIQRVEAQGTASQETAVCLAATFDVELIMIMAVESTQNNNVDDGKSAYQVPRVVLWGGSVALLISILSPIFLTSYNIFSALANFLTIAAIFYIGFGWYFQHRVHSEIDINRKTARGCCIYLACYFTFYAFSDQSEFGAASGLLSCAIFCVIYYILLRKLAEKPAASV